MTDDKDAFPDQAKLYAEAGQVWRHFASWREKTLAGYFTALAALAIVFTQQPSAPVRTVIFLGSILVSGVFWILEDRSRHLINACQEAAARLEKGRGCYTELQQVKKTILTYGFAVGLLVSAVSAASFAAFCLYAIRWYRERPDNWPMWVVGFIVFFVLVSGLRKLADRNLDE